MIASRPVFNNRRAGGNAIWSLACLRYYSHCTELHYFEVLNQQDHMHAAAEYATSYQTQHELEIWKSAVVAFLGPDSASSQTCA